MSKIILNIVSILVPMILSLSVHEWAHAFTAWKLGDSTAADEGRLTLSPDSHIDILGTIIFPAIGAFTGFIFGWAKPVPVNPTRFNRNISAKRGMLLVALAGPVSNLLLAFLCAIILKTMHLSAGDAIFLEGPGEIGARFLSIGLYLNVVLFAFNFVPIPPLDGSKILAGILPEKHQGIVRWLENNQFFLFIALILFGGTFLSKVLIMPTLALIIKITNLEPILSFLNFGLIN